MNNLISFSIWGLNPKYLLGAVENAKLAKTVYPGYKLRFYVDLLIPNSIIYRLETLGAEVIRTNVVGGWKSLFFRHFASAEPFDLVLTRDTDSRLNLREKSAVDAFILRKDKTILILKDHIYHSCSICMPGLLGIKKGAAPNIINDIKNFNQTDQYGTDYVFFDQWLKNVDKSKIMLYDEFNGGLTYPYKRIGDEFVGEVFDENGNPNMEHRAILRKALGR